MENTANRITLTGTLASLPEYSHQNHERKFFRFLKFWFPYYSSHFFIVYRCSRIFLFHAFVRS